MRPPARLARNRYVADRATKLENPFPLTVAGRSGSSSGPEGPHPLIGGFAIGTASSIDTDPFSAKSRTIDPSMASIPGLAYGLPLLAGFSVVNGEQELRVRWHDLHLDYLMSNCGGGHQFMLNVDGVIDAIWFTFSVFLTRVDSPRNSITIAPVTTGR